MIRSEIEAANDQWWRRVLGDDVADQEARVGRYCEHRYKGGPPPRRLRRMQIAHEGRARKAGVPWDTVDLRGVYRHHDGLCGICKAPVSLEEFTIDHIIPLSRGGPHLFENLQPAHKACNSRKGDG